MDVIYDNRRHLRAGKDHVTGPIHKTFPTRIKLTTYFNVTCNPSRTNFASDYQENSECTVVSIICQRHN